MTEYVNMDNARKIYIPASLESEFKDKNFIVLPMPDGDIVFHPISDSKNPLKKLRELFRHEKRPVKEIKKEILESALKTVR